MSISILDGYMLQHLLEICPSDTFIHLISTCSAIYERYKYLIPAKRKESLRMIDERQRRYTVLLNGKREGVHETFHFSGGLYVRWIYINGKLEGLYEMFYESGQLHTKSAYINDKLEGLYEQFYENGQLYTKCTYTK